MNAHSMRPSKSDQSWTGIARRVLLASRLGQVDRVTAWKKDERQCTEFTRNYPELDEGGNSFRVLQTLLSSNAQCAVLWSQLSLTIHA